MKEFKLGIVKPEVVNAVTSVEEAVSIHPKWDTKATTYDYALLKLKTPLDFSGADSAVMPICLPTKNQEFDGEICTATGWGFTKDGGKVSKILKKVDLPIVPFEECKEDYEGVAEVDENTMVCAGYEEGGKSTCEGDSGGPLVCPREDGRYVLAGSTSFGTECAEPGYPPVFSRTSTRLDWIKSIAGETP
ncbi:trypsin-7-like [Ixodes scapularis]|uniref:trypsin-7-like n=1 Tax=Ixodes scapularis TaxID=6945 RepID=UPI001C391511|nr:trypsin-7-like [Ixodes scapularis]